MDIGFGLLLSRYFQFRREELPWGIQQNIDMESYRIRQQHESQISLVRGDGQLDPKVKYLGLPHWDSRQISL